jgi:penicillin-binding protein 1B
LLSFFATGFYLAHLYAEISVLVEQRRAAMNSAIYSAPVAFETGDDLAHLHLVERLQQLGYSRAVLVEHPGQYAPTADGMMVYIRDFDVGVRHFPATMLHVKLNKNRIVALTDQVGSDVKHALLDPQLLGRLMPDAPAERVEVALDQVKPVLIKSLLATEDRFFYYHPGFDPVRIIEAAYIDYRSGHLEQGASTITQQLARTFIPPRRRSFVRKARELAIAMVLEMRYSKHQILERYINDVYLGEFHGAPIYGLPLAARYLFNKDLGDLDYVEMATLIGMIRAPSLYDPHRHPQQCRARRDIVLGTMRRAGVIMDDSALVAAKAAPVVVVNAFLKRPAPYFTDYVTSLVSRMPGLNGHMAGLRVYTTLDTEFQNAAEDSVLNNLERLESEHRNLRRGRDYDPLESSLVAIDPDSGAIRALIGGRDYSSSQYNRAVLAKRQTGSAFKPIVYVSALDPDRSPLEHPLTLASMLPDRPMSFNGWTPVDYEGTYKGQVTVADALAESLNIPTAYLGSLLGPRTFIKTAHEMGIPEDFPNVLPIAIGAGENTLLELTSAYQVFAAGGVARPPYAIESVVDGRGHLVFQHDFQEKRLLKSDVAYVMTGALQGVIQHGTGAKAASMGLNFPAAGKTGTTDEYHDAYFVGYSPDIVCGVWVGFDDPQSIGLPGAQAALPAWVEFMVDTAPSNPANFEVPPGITMASIDPQSGGLATPACPRTVSLPFLSGTEPKHYCSLHSGYGSSTAEASDEETDGEPEENPRYSAPTRGRNIFDSVGEYVGSFFH